MSSPTIGLQVRMRGEMTPLLYLPYAWAPFTGSRDPVDWLTISMSEMVVEHVRCLHVSDEDGCIRLLSALDDGSSTQAVILINSNDSCYVEESIVLKNERWSIPVLVVGSSTGLSIQTLVTAYEKQVEVKAGLQPTQQLSAREIPPTHSASKIPSQPDQRGMYTTVHTCN